MTTGIAQDTVASGGSQAAAQTPQTVTAPTAAPASSTSVTSESQSTTSEGDNALNVSDYARAENYFANALKGTISSKDAEGYLRTGYGEALLWLDKVSEAATQFKKARQILLSGKNTDKARQVRLLDDLAWLAEVQGKQDLALQYAEESLNLAKSSGASSLALVCALIHVGYLQAQNSQLEKAAATYKEALNATAKAEGPESRLGADIKEQLGGILRRQGHAQEALDYFSQELQVKLAANAPLRRYSPHPYWNDIIFRFNEGAPNCYRKFENGTDLQIVTANGITVAAAMPTDKGYLVKANRVEISIRNDSNSEVQFLSKSPIFYELAPKVILARQIDSAALADNVEKKGQKKASWIRFMGQDATQPVTTTMIGNGGMWGFPPVYSSYGTMPMVSRSGNMTTVTTQVPDYAAQARALAKAAAVSGKAHDTADQIRNQSLGPTVLAPGQELNGSLYFDVEKVTRASLQVPVGNATFAFEFPPH
ncbi:MAG TPA: tetratricopeptide repeat protein [Oculatellaceae cyanobacterium]